MLNCNYHMETSAHVPPLRTLIQPLLVILKRRWSGRESKACPPTYGSPRSQLLLWDSAQWVSLRLCYLLSLSLPAAHSPSGDALFSRSLTVYHFPISSPTTWCGFFVSLLSAWLSEESPRLQQGQLETTDAVLEPLCWTTCLNISPSSPLILTPMQQTCTFLPNGWMHTYCTI